MTTVGALVLSSAQPERVVEFYRGLGLPLAEEDHDDGIVHWSCELDGIHFAVFRAEDAGPALGIAKQAAPSLASPLSPCRTP